MKSLHLVHHSSQDPVGEDYEDVYMSSADRPPWTAENLEECEADVLGAADLDGWIMADHLIGLAGQMKGRPVLFENLTSLSFGVFDDGRWESYRGMWEDGYEEEPEDGEDSEDSVRVKNMRDRDMHNSEDEWDSEEEWNSEDEDLYGPRAVWDRNRRNLRNVCPTSAIVDILCKVFYGGARQLPIDTCFNPRAGIDISDIGTGLNVIHGPSLRSYGYRDRTRLYMNTDPVDANVFSMAFGRDLGPLSVAWDYPHHLRFRPITFDSEDGNDDEDKEEGLRRLNLLATRELEICITPTIEGSEIQMQVARQAKEAVDTFCQQEENKEYVDKFLAKYRVLVGDEIPACPCCESRR